MQRPWRIDVGLLVVSIPLMLVEPTRWVGVLGLGVVIGWALAGWIGRVP